MKYDKDYLTIIHKWLHTKYDLSGIKIYMYNEHSENLILLVMTNTAL